MNNIDKIINALNRIFVVIAGTALVLMMLLTCLNITARLFGKSIHGTFEIMGFLAAVTASFALAYTQLKKDNISVGLVQEKLPPILRRITSGINGLLCFGISILASWQIFLYASSMVRSGEVTEALRMPFYPFVFAVSIGFSLLSLAFLLDFIKSSFNIENNPNACEKEFELDDISGEEK